MGIAQKTVTIRGLLLTLFAMLAVVASVVAESRGSSLPYQTLSPQPNDFAKIHQFESHSRWGDPAFRDELRIVEVSAQGCEVADSKPTDCEELVSSQSWDGIHTVVIHAEGLATALMTSLPGMATNQEQPFPEDVMAQMANVMVILYLLRDAGVQYVNFGVTPFGGMLAAIFEPALLDYDTRAQVSEAFRLSDPYRHKVAEHTASNGEYPTATDLEALLDTIVSDGKFSKISVIPKTGTIVATFKNIEHVHSSIAGKTIRWVPSVTGANGPVFEFQCISSIEQKFLPRSCASRPEVP